MVDFRDIEDYCKEVTRSHLREFGLRVFKHPTYSSALIVTKENYVLGMVGYSILSDNSKTRNYIDEGKYLKFEY